MRHRMQRDIRLEPGARPAPPDRKQQSHKEAAMTDEINSPSHYMLFPDMEAIDVIIAALTPEEFAGYCKGNALKYRLRAGAKGPAEKCIAKANWYQQKLRQQARADFGQQNTIDCRTPEEKAEIA